MHKLSVLGALCLTAQISFSIATAAAAGISLLSGVPGPGAPGPDRAVIFVGGMGGGGAGMGGGGAGMGGAGMGGGFGGMGGAGMRGGQFGFGDSSSVPARTPGGRPRTRRAITLISALRLRVAARLSPRPHCAQTRCAVARIAYAPAGRARVGSNSPRARRTSEIVGGPRSPAARSITGQMLPCPRR